MKELKPYEEITLALIKEDMRFMISVLDYCRENHNYSYLLSLLPYLGLIVDQSKKWGDKVFKDDKSVPKMNSEEKEYYELMREKIKLWETTPMELDNYLNQKFKESKNYFISSSSKIGQKLRLIDIYGISVIKSENFSLPISNTILLSTFIPGFEYSSIDSKYIINMTTYAGELAGYYLEDEIKINSSINMYRLKTSWKIEDYDFGSFIKGPFLNYSSDFVLFSLLNECLKVLYGVNRISNQRAPIKLRISYILYYYLCDNLDSMNEYFNLNLSINPSWKNKDLRNSMAHYSLGKILRNDTNKSDAFGGVTNKLLGISWNELLINIDDQIQLYVSQLEGNLNNKNIIHKYTAWNKVD